MNNNDLLNELQASLSALNSERSRMGLWLENIESKKGVSSARIARNHVKTLFETMKTKKEELEIDIKAINRLIIRDKQNARDKK